MKGAEPSYTAMRAAAHRAAHQTREAGRIFTDPLACAVLGENPEAAFGSALDEPQVRGMRWLIAARSAFAEQQLSRAVARGVRQYVVLGAGLDTFAHRNPHPALRVFEVDHPATQAWKRERLRAAGFSPSPTLAFVAVDFERRTLAEGLADAGFDRGAPAFFSWLGVVIYLTREAIFETLSFIGGAARGEVAFDYGEPHAAYPSAQQAALRARDARMGALGEPWLTRFEPEALGQDLRGLGFDEIEDLRPSEIARRFYGRAGRDGPGAHLVRARRKG